MAVVKYSNLIEELRGKLNGTVFSRYLEGFSAYKKGQPSPWGSSRQQTIRQNFQVLAGEWGQLTPGQRANWDFVAANSPVRNRLGELVHISGYAYFQKFQLNERSLGNFTYPVPNLTLNLPYGFEIYGASLNATLQGSFYEITQLQTQFRVLQTSLDSNYFTIYISLPFSRPDQNYTGTYYQVGYIFRSQGLLPGNTFTSVISAMVMPSGWASFEDAFHRLKVVARTQNSAQEGDPFFFTVQATFTPPVVTYEPELDAVLGIMNPVPNGQQLENLNNWILGLKSAAGLTPGVFNLNQAYDVAYNFAINSFDNALIDYVSSASRATEIANPGRQVDFQAFRGISRGIGGTVALDTNWNVTAGSQNATPLDNHQTLAITTADTASMTGRIAGSQLENFEFIPLQNVGGGPMFRFRSGGLTLSNFANPNVRGAFGISRSDAATVHFSRNASPPITATNNLQGYTNESFLLLSTKEAGEPEAPRVDTQIASFTAGLSSVDLTAVNAAIRNYLSANGFDLYI